MKIELNGEPVELEAGATVLDAAGRLGVGPDARGVAAALDGEVLPRGDWAQTKLASGQKVEIVQAIQGGAPGRVFRSTGRAMG